MTPAYASIAFVAIAILISVLRDLLFPQTLSSSSQSSISFDKMYTVSNKKYTPPNKNYGSLYQSYYQFHADQKYRNQKANINNTIKLQDYNSYVLKKSIINDEHTVICNEDFLITINEGISCQEDMKCEWNTHFSIYELPLLKQQAKQVVSLTGQIGLSRYLTQNDKKKRLFCKKVRNRQEYVMNFPMSHLRNQTNDGQFWSLNDLYITKINQTSEKLKNQDTIKTKQQKNNKNNQDNKSDQPNQKKRSRAEKEKKSNSKSKQSQPQIQNQNFNFNKSSQSQSNKTFQILHYTYNLQYKSHRPFIHYCDGFCTTYVTRQQPWIIRYNCDDQWKQINILESKIQKFIFSKLNQTTLIPPFQRQNLIKPRYLYTYQSQIIQYKLDCNKQQCSEIQVAQSDHYLTYVFDHVNSKYRVQKFIMQLTFNLKESIYGDFRVKKIYQQKDKDVNVRSLKKNSRKLIKQDKTYILETQQKQKSAFDRLRSHSIIVSQVSPKIKIYTDCQINRKVDTHYYRYYDKYYWLYENRPIYSIQRWGLLCIIVFDLDSTIRITQIQDILYRQETKKRSLADIYNIKDFKRYLNYRNVYQKQINLIEQLYKAYLNSTDLNSSTLSKKEQNYVEVEFDQFFKEMWHYVGPAFPNHYVDETNDKNNISTENFDEQKSLRKAKPLKKNKFKKQKKTVKQRKNKTKGWQKYKRDLLFTPVQIKDRRISSFYWKLNGYGTIMSFPHISQTKRHRFPLPFQLSLTNNMKIINQDLKKPLILFSAVKNYLFTYKETIVQDPQSKVPQTKVDYRYMVLGVPTHSSSKVYLQKFKTMDQVKNVIEQASKDPNSKADNFLKSIFEAENDILNEIKSISSISVERISEQLQKFQGDNLQDFKRYVIVVWGWGIQVYQVNWQKNMQWKYDQKRKKVQMQLNSSTDKTYISMSTFIPFVQLFATVYCMFQILITSR